MLTHLNVRNFAIAECVDVDFHRGMTVISGETGAGKSILLDAIGLALGDRADTSSIGPFGDKTDISASFDIRDNPSARAWLAEQALDSGDECILRRVLSKDGKSKAFINNSAATLNAIKAVGELLIDIHGQHAHQSLLHSNHQRQILDEFGKLEPLTQATRIQYDAWRALQQRYKSLTESAADANARADYLKFQLADMANVVIPPETLAELNQEQQVLANAGEIIHACQTAYTAISDDDNALSRLRQAIRLLQDAPIQHSALDETIELLDSAAIQAEEAASTLLHFSDTIEIDEQRLMLLDSQLGEIHSLARKHHVGPDQLFELQQSLQHELDNTEISDADMASLADAVKRAEQDYTHTAKALSEARASTAIELKHAIEIQLQQLSMAGCRVEFCLEPSEASPLGLEKVKLCIASNPGLPLQAINKTASGGELSRIGLAVQVATAQINAVPVMIFDEVDSGVGGAVAEVVGNLMRQLSDNRQVFCVTHLAQVASKAHNHYVVSKTAGGNTTTTELQELNDAQRLHEIARMLGGLTISEQTLAHAKEMLTS